MPAGTTGAAVRAVGAPAGGRRRVPAAALLLTLAGAWLRWRALAADLRLTPDEAFFSTFARAAAIQGDWWLGGALDKPPLALYANALAQAAIGPLEPAARLPGALAGILLLPLLYVLTRDLYRSGSGTPALVALMLAACSPALVATADALTDGLMLTGVTAALWLALRGRPGCSGLLFGLALASKQQALFCLPLVLWAARGAGRTPSRPWLRFSRPLALCVILFILWDHARPGASIHQLALANNLPAEPADAGDLPGRLLIWLEHAGAIFWPAWPGRLLLLNGLLVLVWRARAKTRGRDSRSDLAPAAFVAGYSLLHWLSGLPLYARYLLPLLPALLPPCARGLCHSAALLAARMKPLRRSDPRLALLPATLALMLLQPAPGPDPHAGMDDLGAWLAARPVATVIYDRWLGWQLGFYLGPWHDKRVTWYPDPVPLVRDARRLCEFGPRYFPAPRDADARPWLEALRAGGFAVTRAWQNAGYEVWQLAPPWRERSECPASP